jgi:hypothetical protein
MTSLGNYASASVLSCNDLIVRNFTNMLTPVYGIFDLSQNVVTGTGSLLILDKIKERSSSLVRGITLVNGNSFIVSQSGIYKVEVLLEGRANSGNIIQTRSRVVLGAGLVVQRGGHDFQSSPTNISVRSIYYTAIFEITDPATQNIQIQQQGAVTGGGSMSWVATESQIFISKLV